MALVQWYFPPSTITNFETAPAVEALGVGAARVSSHQTGVDQR